MKLQGISRISYPLSILSLAFALANSEAQAGAMGPVEVAPGQLYLGVFGGAGSSTKTNIYQYGTAYYLEPQGGPLAVFAFGRANRRNVGLVGGHIGYRWMEIPLDAFHSSVSLSPAAELEGYYMGKGHFTGHAINNTTRLPEHDFVVNYPMETGVFLGNAIVNFNPVEHPRWHPYVGWGIGAAVSSISNADAMQISPAEPGVNHYNSNNADSISAFATQIKAGLHFDICKNTNIFVEYRWLHIADTHYIFGSTVYPNHPETSSWQVRLNSHQYNMGAVGLQYSV